MVFSSLFFNFFFLPIILIFYFFTKSDQLKNVILVFFSLIFYAWGEPIWFVLLIISAIVDYLNGIFVENNKDSKIAMLGVISTLIFNLGLLCTFKYADFFIENVNFLLGSSFKAPGLILPIGISFYTFQTISYTVDIYRGHLTPSKTLNIINKIPPKPKIRYLNLSKVC